MGKENPVLHVMKVFEIGLYHGARKNDCTIFHYSFRLYKGKGLL